MNLAVQIAWHAIAGNKEKFKTNTAKKKQSLRSKTRFGVLGEESEKKAVFPIRKEQKQQEQEEEQAIAYMPENPLPVKGEPAAAAAPEIDLQQAILWSEILGEPACRRKHRRTGRRYGN